MILQSAMTRSRVRVGIGAVIILLIVALGVAVLVSAFSSAGTSRTVAAISPSGAPTGAPTPASGSGTSGSGTSGSGAPRSGTPGIAIFVHILGAVAKPGLYQLHDGDRAVDAVAAAGGFTKAADKQQLNLARFVSDGEQIYVPTVGETAGTAPSGARPSGAATSSGAKVNINTADEAELETLPRVGPAMAKRIIAWRETNGRFSSVEDLMGVTGIGEKTFAELKELVTV